MKKIYEEVKGSFIGIDAKDGVYEARFDRELNYGKTWEFDPMSDAVGQYKSVPTGNMRVRFQPMELYFPEDEARKKEYVMDIESARILYKLLRNKQPQYWFALDMANQGSKHGLQDLEGQLKKFGGIVIGHEIA